MIRLITPLVDHPLVLLIIHYIVFLALALGLSRFFRLVVVFPILVLLNVYLLMLSGISLIVELEHPSEALTCWVVACQHHGVRSAISFPDEVGCREEPREHLERAQYRVFELP